MDGNVLLLIGNWLSGRKQRLTLGDQGHVQLASDFRKRLRAAISCHLTQTSKEST